MADKDILSLRADMFPDSKVRTGTKIAIYFIFVGYVESSVAVTRTVLCA